MDFSFTTQGQIKVEQIVQSSWSLWLIESGFIKLEDLRRTAEAKVVEDSLGDYGAPSSLEDLLVRFNLISLDSMDTLRRLKEMDVIPPTVRSK